MMTGRYDGPAEFFHNSSTASISAGKREVVSSGSPNSDLYLRLGALKSLGQKQGSSKTCKAQPEFIHQRASVRHQCPESPESVSGIVAFSRDMSVLREVQVWN
jgi:hypothetical protein